MARQSRSLPWSRRSAHAGNHGRAASRERRGEYSARRQHAQSKLAAVAEPDGYTLFGTTAWLAIAPALYKNAGYDRLKRFDPVAMTSDVPYIMAIRPDLPAKDTEKAVVRPIIDNDRSETR
jgi:hypothetical protein